MTWWTDAACRKDRLPALGASASWWTDDDAGPMERGDALRICLTCQVRTACLSDCMRTEPAGATGSHRFTIRGATTPSERERLNISVSWDDLRVSLRLWCWSCGAPVAWRPRGRGVRTLPRWCPKCKEEAA